MLASPTAWFVIFTNPVKRKSTANRQKFWTYRRAGTTPAIFIGDPAGKKLYIAVGSSSNVDEDGADAKDPRRAAILEINPDGSAMRGSLAVCGTPSAWIGSC